jgi:5'-nucleotidase
METNFSNIIVDIMSYFTKSDCMILNSGTLRADIVFPKGTIRYKEIQMMFPMIDPIVVMKVKGEIIHKLLENGISSYPKLEGKFPIVSGIKFTYDSKLPVGNRIKKSDIFIKGEPLDYERVYITTTKNFISQGKDGYTDFIGCEYITDEHSGFVLQDIIEKMFNDVLDASKEDTTNHREAMLKIVNNPEGEIKECVNPNNENDKRSFYVIKPSLDGRIVNLSEETAHHD